MNRSFYKPKCRQSIHDMDTAIDSASSSSPSNRFNPYLLQYLEYGFTYIGSEECPKPKCLICYQVLNNNYMTPGHLQSHLTSKHKEYQNKSRKFFEKQLAKLEKAQNRERQRSTFMDWSVANIDTIPSPTKTIQRQSSIKNVTPTRKSINRQYNEDFLKFGFTYVGNDAAKQKPKCLLCYEILPNSSMHESALHDHLESKHAEYIQKPKEFFAKQLEKIEKAKTKSRRSSLTSLATVSLSPKSASVRKMDTALLYSSEFLKFGFTYTGDEMKPNPQCILCNEILPNSSMRQSTLYQHLESRHKKFINYPIEYFEEQLAAVERNTRKLEVRRRSSNQNLAPVKSTVQPVTPKKTVTPRKSTPGRKSTGQKYTDDFLQFGFTYIGDETKPKPKCLLCYEILPNSCMHESALHDHLTTKHKEFTDKPVEFFVKQLNKFLKSQGRAVTSM